MERSTRIREPHRQICPWFANAERRMVDQLASLAYQSAKISVGFFPPISSDTFLNVFAAVAALAAPVRVEPVNEIALMPGCATNALPARGPVPCTMLSTPAGSW